MSWTQYDPNLATTAQEELSEELIFGESRAMRLIQAKLTSVATSQVPVLIHGESGTGKELLARIIHRHSSVGNHGTFVKVNCPAVPVPLFESELFGYEKGAFTGAFGKKLGRVALANQGTLFLDEISEIDSASQAKLLQLVQDGSFCSIGGQHDTKVHIRIICASNRDLDVEVGNGSFREDLYYRINVVNLRLPSLRERRADIPNLVSYFIELFNLKFNCRARSVSPDLMSALQAYHWPGNIRQLENMMKRYVILGSEEVIATELNSQSQTSQTFTGIPDIAAGEAISLKDITRDMVRDFERQVITKMLEAHRWNRAQAARALNISYRALLYKVKRSQLVSPRVGSHQEQQ